MCGFGYYNGHIPRRSSSAFISCFLLLSLVGLGGPVNTTESDVPAFDNI